MKKILFVYSMHVTLGVSVPLAAAVNSPPCLVTCFVCVEEALATLQHKLLGHHVIFICTIDLVN